MRRVNGRQVQSYSSATFELGFDFIFYRGTRFAPSVFRVLPDKQLSFMPNSKSLQSFHDSIAWTVLLILLYLSVHSSS